MSSRLVQTQTDDERALVLRRVVLAPSRRLTPPPPSLPRTLRLTPGRSRPLRPATTCPQLPRGPDVLQLRAPAPPPLQPVLKYRSA